MSLRALYLTPLLAWPMLGCASHHDHIEGEDYGTFFPTLRTSIDLDREAPVPLGRWEGDEGLHGNLTLDFQVSGADGDTREHLRSGDDVQFEGFDLTGPADYVIDYDLRMASVLFAGTLYFPHGLLLSAGLGIGYSELDLELTSTGQREREEIRALGPAFTARASWFPEPVFGLYAELGNRVGFPREYDSVSIDQLELGLELRPTPGLALFGGWRWLTYYGDDEYRHRHDSNDNSELDLDLSGPVAGLSLSF